MLNKTIPTSIGLTIILIVAVSIGIIDYWFYQELQNIKSEITELKYPEKNLTLNPLNATYKIEGEEFTLVNGKAEKEITPGSASKIEVVSWGKPVLGDLNADGVNDAALILTYSAGGSGSFYHIAVALKGPQSGTAIGTNGISLGDRIAPQNISITDGEITVNYADRKSNEPFITPPSVGITRIFSVQDGILGEITSESAKKEQGCAISGGTIKTSLCCASTGDFANLCLVGACGCSSTNSHEVKICDCGADKCFDGTACVFK